MDPSAFHLIKVHYQNALRILNMVCSGCHCPCPNLAPSPPPPCPCPGQGVEPWEIPPVHNPSYAKLAAGAAPSSWAPSDENGSRMIQGFPLSSAAFVVVSILASCNFKEKHAQAKMNALLILKQFRWNFYASFSLQSWHVLQNSFHCARLHSLLLFIKARWTENQSAFCQKLWVD